MLGGGFRSDPAYPGVRTVFNKEEPVKRVGFFVYGGICYAASVAALVYAAGFIANIGVPRSIDSAPAASFLNALLIDLALLGVFAIQHSVMARAAFKRRWTKIVPKPIERSTYCLMSAAALGLLMWQWRPMGGMIWDVGNPTMRMAIYGISLVGWAILYYSSFLINHFDLFGLRQVWLYLTGKPYTPVVFREPTLYRYVRHPLYVGMLTAVWATPTMTVAHLVFAIGVLGYILVGIRFEEHDLVAEHGKPYAEYRRRVPMLVPSVRPAAARRTVEHHGAA
jgi:protein-S-isoprenylcysteine O-methyltransferase Ste14